ncbi:MAG: TonB-dependent receptor plug [Chlorobi bacterium OLB7]|nr:MAG: TonB-dependent receptor plug [Chlorobi bacterium OLB7]
MILALLLIGASGAAAQGVTISGSITEANSGEAITGATVALFRESDSIKPARGGISNRFGFYSIPNVAPGRYNLVARSIGAQQRVQSILIPESRVLTLVESGDTTASTSESASECRISLIADSGADVTATRLNICLQPKQVTGREVVVVAERYDDAAISTVAIDPQLSKKLPSLGGEPDIMRTLQLLPGIKAGSEISSGLYIRGGSPDQNLILLDGVTVYNPSHIGGFLSTFNSDAIRDVKVMKGIFPAEYGGRLSGVVDMTMREGTKEKFSGAAGISLLNSRLTVEGPISDDISFMVSGRRMYMDLAMKLAGNPEDVPDYYFYDLNGKMNWRLSESDQLFVSGYSGRDDFRTDPSGTDQLLLNWGNATANLRWSHIVSPTIFTNFSAIFTNYDCSSTLMQVVMSSPQSGFKTYSQIRDITARGQAQMFAGEDHIIKTGFEVTNHQFSASASDVVSELEKVGAAPTTLGGTEGGFFLQDEWQITPRLQANIGARASYFSNGNHLRIEPRVSLAYSITDNITARGGYSANNQYLHMITRNDIALPTDIWFPATARVKPATAEQVAAGIETRLFDNQVLLSVEGYYKSMNNLLEFQDTASFSLLAPLESSFTVGDGKAYGVEVFLNKQIGALTGWVGYTLSWADRTFAELNRGKTFYPTFDRRHDISVVATYKLSDSWEVGASWVYATGRAVSVPTGQFIYQRDNGRSATYAPESRYDFIERNGYRLPAFHKLDLNFTHNFQWFALPFALSLNVYNAYNHQNVFSQAVDTDFAENATTGESYQKHVLQRTTLFPTLLTVGISCKF